MPKFTAADAECLVFTFKDGLLSKIAHDLKIQVNRFEVEVNSEPPSVRASFEVASLEVVCAMKNGEENPGSLSDPDKAKIAKQIGAEVLHSGQHAQATFESTSASPTDGGGYAIEGNLTLHGVTKQISVQALTVDGSLVATLSLHQPDYGITPFKAMMGTLKVKPDVQIRLTIPQ